MAILLCVTVAMITAQVIKYLLSGILYGKWAEFGLLVSTGGMPSSHSAAVVALAVEVFKVDGFSTSFSISVVLAVIVMIDAIGVRRAAGKHAEVLNSIQQVFSEGTPKPLKELLGHTPLQVFVGSLLGATVSLFIPFEQIV